MTLTERQAHALLHPLGYAPGDPLGYAPGDPRDLDPYRRIRRHPRGLLTTIPAVDRQARLNDGRPVWHVSVSLQRPSRLLSLPAPLEVAAVRALAGVGGDHEWWLWNPTARVGHLRVPVTPEEFALIPPGCVISDAGDTGPRRPRTHLRGAP